MIQKTIKVTTEDFKKKVSFRINNLFKETEISLNKPVIKIGREQDNDIILNDPTVSKYHAEITMENDKLVIKDLDSLNGIYINDIPIKKEEIKSDDEIYLGATILELI